MAQYIDKSALVAEIKKKIKETEEHWKTPYGIETATGRGILMGYRDILSFLDTLEVKAVGVDLGDPKGDKSAKYIIDTKTLEVKEVQEPTAADRGMVEEIIINLKRVEQDYHIDLTKEMEWLRNKVRKGE